MAENFILDLIGSLQKAKSRQQINSDLKQLEKAVNMLRITGTFAKGDTKKELNSYIKSLQSKLEHVKLTAKIDNKNLKSEIDKALNNVTFKEIEALNVDESKIKLKVRKVIADTKAYVDKNNISINIGMKKEKLSNDLTAYLNIYSKIKESSVLLEEAENVRELIDSIDDKKSLREATDAFQLYKSEVSATGFATKSTTERVKDMISKITKVGSLFGVASLAVSSFRKSLQTLKEVDTYLTEISKANEKLSKLQLNQIGNDSFVVASNYGKMATNYLSAVQEMSRAGYENVSGMAELSVAAQGAGDMTQDLANQYIIATDKAYKLGGSVEKLTEILDGSNYITNHNAVTMTDLADGMSIVGSTASSFGVDVNEATAALGTMIATTQQSGSEAARAFRAILLNIRQVTDEEEGIDAEGLTKYEAACKALNVSLKETKNGITSLRDPMEVLRELSIEYNKLEESDIRRTNLLSSVGGKLRSTQLDALLRQWETYEKMLQEYASGTGSMAVEAEKTANSWEGRLNSLQNSWDSFVGSLANKDSIMSGVTFFDRLIQGAEALTDAIGEIPVLLTAINGSMTAINKDYGITQIYNKGTGKLDIQGNIFGIDFSAIKLQKKHFTEAEKAISYWNKELKAGNTDLNEFNNSVVKNNAQLKAYLKTTSKDAPASLEGYKSYLNEAGISTDALRLKTILLNSAISLGIGLAVQAAVQGIIALIHSTEEARQKAQELGAEFTNTKSDIDGYKEKIKELYETINDSGSSIEDVTNARKTLMSVQDELIEKFGTEKGVINDVTDAINGQTEAFDRLTQAQWQEVKNEFNNGGFWNGVANFFQGTDNIGRMLDEYGEKTVAFIWEDYADIDKLTDEMVAELENIGIDIRVSTDYSQYSRAFDSLNESVSDSNITGARLMFTGNAEEIYNQVLALQNLINNDESFDKLYNRFESAANYYKDLTDKYKEFYNQYILYEKVLTDGSEYTDIFKNITDAYEEYSDAFASGDEDKIKEATEKYASIVSNAMATALANGDSDVADYFENMYPTLKSVVSGWEFNVAFDANTDDLQDKVQSVLDELKDENGRQLTTEEILGLGAGNEQYQELVSIAHSYNMTLEEMIALLKERNLVADMDYQGLVALFGQENVDKLTPEDLEIAYKVKNVGNMTFDELIAEIQRVKDEASRVEEVPILSVSETIDQLNTKLKPAFDSLKSAYQDIFTSDGFELNSINIISTCDSIKSKLDDMAKLGLEVDYSAYEDLVKVLSDSESTEQDVQNAFDSLATSIAQAALTGAEDFQTMKAALEDLGVVNSELVAFDALISNTETLKEAGLDLANTTDVEIEAFARKRVSVENLTQAIDMLTFHKQLCNLQKMDTAEEVVNLRTLAENAGYTGEVIQYLTELEQIYQQIASGTLDAFDVGGKILRAAQLQTLIQQSASNISYKPKVDFTDTTKSAKSAGSSAGKAFTDALDKELAVLDKKMEAGYIDFKDYIQARLNLIEDYYRQGKLSADEYYSYLEKHYKQELSYMDKVVSAVTRKIDKEIDSLEKKKDDIESYYKVQIDALEKEKSLLEEANRERQRQLDLQKAMYELERARNQRTTLIYSEDKGMHYVADDKSIRDAKEDVEKAEFEIKISEIEKAISKLEESRDRETDAIDEMIDKLKEYRDHWKDVTSAYEETQEDLIAAQILGQDWEQQILDQRLDTLNKFKDGYIAIQQAMVDAAYQAAQAMAKAQKATIGDSSKGKLNGGDNNAEHGWEVVDESTASTVKKGFATKDDADKYAEQLDEKKAASLGMSMREFVNSDIPGYYSKKYHTGLQQGLVDKNSFDDDFKLVQKVGLGEKEVPAILQEGEAVATPEQISNIADGLRDPRIPDYLTPLPDDHPIVVASKQFEEMFKANGMPYFENTALKKMNDELTRTINNMNTVNNSRVQQINQEFHITLPNVTNSTSAEALMKDLQSISTKKFQAFS